MKHSGWVYGLVLLLVISAVPCILGGCAKPTFSIVEKKVCKNVGPAGHPVQETTTFSPTDGRVCIWFRYRNAAPNQVIKAKFTYTDPLGHESTQEMQAQLKPGSSVGVVELVGEDGGPLAVGRYVAELTDESNVSYGPPLTFTVE